MDLLPKVSIIFPNYNGGKEPLECLSSIRKLNYPNGAIEIIVIDNHSTDSSDLAIKKKFKEVKLIQNKNNSGFAKAINQGLKIARGSYIFIGNDDIVFEKNSLLDLINYSLSHPDVGVLGGKIFFKNPKNKICSTGYMMNKWTGNVYASPNPNIIKEPDWVQGCALLIPKRVFTKVGLYDSGYFLSFDDYDLCQRVKNAGFKVVYYPHAVFWHGESLTVDKNPSFKYFHWYKSKIRFIIKHLPPVNIASIMFIQLLFITPARAIILQDGRFVPFLKGFIWNLAHLNKTLRARKAQLDPQDEI